MRRIALLLVPAAGLLAFTTGGAGAADPSTASPTVGVFSADLQPAAANPSGPGGTTARGAAYLVRVGDRLTGTIYVSGLSPNLPHAMHIHGKAQAAAECPGPGRDTSGDGLVDTLEGLVDYGPILVSFTTSGGTGGNLLPDGLDLSRYSVASSAGYVVYSRTFSIPVEVADRLGELHIVVHGADLNGNGSYDGVVSSLTTSGAVPVTVPLEAELPVACGPIHSLR